MFISSLTKWLLKKSSLKSWLSCRGTCKEDEYPGEHKSVRCAVLEHLTNQLTKGGLRRKINLGGKECIHQSLNKRCRYITGKAEVCTQLLKVVLIVRTGVCAGVCVSSWTHIDVHLLESVPGLALWTSENPCFFYKGFSLPMRRG